MTLREQIILSPETLSDLEWAARERFHEGEELLFSRRFSGAIYLLGLASEMWLKLSCFRFQGHTPNVEVMGLLGSAYQWMKIKAPHIDKESFHSLQFWAEYLILLRAEKGYPLPRRLIGQLRHHISNRLHNDWKIDMRYRIIALAENDALRVYNDVLWLVQARNDLRS
jgi:hypothetical protein